MKHTTESMLTPKSKCNHSFGCRSYEHVHLNALCCLTPLTCVQISLDMATWNTTYFDLVNQYWLFRPGGSVLQAGPISTPNWSPMGLIFNDFGSLRPDDWGPGQVCGST